MKKRMIFGVAVLATAAGLLIASGAFAGQKRNVGQAWPANQLVSMETIDHSPWDALLKKYVDGNGYVNYKALKASANDRRVLQQYLTSLSRANPQAKASRAAQLAFWINAYNAVTVEGILQQYPTDSIRNHTAKVLGYNIWKDLLLTVGQNRYSLENIEHKILRPMKEPRVHFAIVCASVGCPRLLNEAYTKDRIEKQLVLNTQSFFADRTKFSYDLNRRQINVSPILQWFATDFGKNSAAQMKTIAPYLPDRNAQQLAASGQATVRYVGYDWKLNDQARLRKQQPGSGNRAAQPGSGSGRR